MVPIAWFLAILLRFNLTTPPASFIENGLEALLVIIPIQLITFLILGLYRGIWRFASIPDLRRILKAVLLGALIVSLLSALLFRLENIPRTVLILFPLVLIGGLAGPRLSYRLIKDKGFRLRKKEGIRTLVVGAGIAGETPRAYTIANPGFRPDKRGRVGGFGVSRKALGGGDA